MKNIFLSVFLVMCFSESVYAHSKDPLAMNASYATGVSVGESVGTGLFIRKYFQRNYVQLVGAYEYSSSSEGIRDNVVSNLAFAFGRYFYQEDLTAIELPVGLHYFFSMNSQYWHRDEEPKLMGQLPTRAFLYPGIGLAIDFFNPGTIGVGASFSIGYGSRIEFVEDNYKLENLYIGAVFASASLVYNW